MFFKAPLQNRREYDQIMKRSIESLTSTIDTKNVTVYFCSFFIIELGTVDSYTSKISGLFQVFQKGENEAAQLDFIADHLRSLNHNRFSVHQSVEIAKMKLVNFNFIFLPYLST